MVHSWVLLALIFWRVPAYRIEIQVRPDISLQVHEQYQVDFRQDPHHGIYRQIPVFYRRGILFQNLRLQVLKVLRNQNPEPYKTWLRGRDLMIRIGSPHRRVSGLETYDLVYRIRYGLDFENDSAYLYFNAVGPQWSVPLEHGVVVVTLPPNTPYGTAHAWLGPPGSRRHRIPAQVLDERHLLFQPREAVMPGQAFTVVVAMPARFFVKPDLMEQIWHQFTDNLVFLIPLFTFFLLLGAWYRWGRDPALRRRVVVRYDPPADLTPGEAGVLVDERVNPRDLAATLLDLARRGYLVIQSEARKMLFFTVHRYRLTLKKPDLSDLKMHEKALLEALFPYPRVEDTTVEHLEIRERLRRKIGRITRAFYRAVTRAGYFPVAPNWVRVGVFSLGIVIFAGAILLGTLKVLQGPLILSFLFSAVLVMAFSPFMPRKTPKGVRKYLEVKGFEEFLRRVDRDRIQRLGRDADAYFAELLPYAVVFGVEDRILEAFDGLLSGSPTWFVGPAGQPLPANTFGSSLSGALGHFSGLFSAASRGGASGGGSAGGGVGGGGGGAW